MTIAQKLYSWSWLAESGYWSFSLSEIECWESLRSQWRKTAPRHTETQWAALFGIDPVTLAPRAVKRFKNALDPVKIKQSVLLSEVVGQYTPITMRGNRYWANCPFHEEKHASFVINDEMGKWRCFGACGRGGDVIQFLMEKENLSFVSALKVLSACV